MFEIGSVYIKNSKFFLAVAEDKIITVIKEKVKEISPYFIGSYTILRNMSVKQLCARWNIKISKLDYITSLYLIPSATGIINPSLNSRRRRLENLYLNQQSITVKLHVSR